MIESIVTAAARRLLSQGISRRRVAGRLKLSRGTVNNLAAQDFETAKRDQAKRARRENKAKPSSAAIRCRGCGGKVFPPCKLCETRGQ